MKPPASLINGIHRLWQNRGAASTMLLPLSWLVHLSVLHSRRRYRALSDPDPAAQRPIVVVGNIIVGGTGKTPVVIALVEALAARGWRPGVVSRGYGVKIKGHPRVGQGQLDAAGFGDEPALIARKTGAPLAVHPSRVLAVRALIVAHPEIDVIISDDGLQHLALRRDIEIVVQDARGLGNGRMLPAGPLREPANKLSDVDYLITNLGVGQIGPSALDIPARQLCMSLHPERITHLASGLVVTWPEWLARHANGTVGAVAAIGQPERFFSMLRSEGLRLTVALALPDHDPYSSSPFTDLQADLVLVTAKDAVKCARFNDPRVWVVNVAPQFSDTGWLEELNEKLHVIAEKKKAGSIKLAV